MIRLALIGCGCEADAYPSIRARLPGARFVAVADADRDRARIVAARLEADSWGAGLDELQAGGAAFDAVVIHGASRDRADIARQAAHLGRHVLAAAPLALAVDEADRVAAACDAAGVRLMVGSSERFLPSVRAMKGALDSGKLGTPGLLRIHRWSAVGALTARERDAVQARAGGPLWDAAVREIDLARWMFGAMPDFVYATGGSTSGGPPDAPSDDAQIHLGFPEGGMALIDCVSGLPTGSGYATRSLIGSTGAAYVDDHHNSQLVFRGGDPAARPTGEGPLNALGLLSEFVEAIAAGREPAVTARDGRATVQIAAAAAASIASGRAARWSESGGRYELV